MPWKLRLCDVLASCFHEDSRHPFAGRGSASNRPKTLESAVGFQRCISKTALTSQFDGWSLRWVIESGRLWRLLPVDFGAHQTYIKPPFRLFVGRRMWCWSGRGMRHRVFQSSAMCAPLTPKNGKPGGPSETRCGSPAGGRQRVGKGLGRGRQGVGMGANAARSSWEHRGFVSLLCAKGSRQTRMASCYGSRSPRSLQPSRSLDRPSRPNPRAHVSSAHSQEAPSKSSDDLKAAELVELSKRRAYSDIQVTPLLRSLGGPRRLSAKNHCHLPPPLLPPTPWNRRHHGGLPAHLFQVALAPILPLLGHLATSSFRGLSLTGPPFPPTPLGLVIGLFSDGAPCVPGQQHVSVGAPWCARGLLSHSGLPLAA